MGNNHLADLADLACSSPVEISPEATNGKDGFLSTRQNAMSRKKQTFVSWWFHSVHIFEKFQAQSKPFLAISHKSIASAHLQPVNVKPSLTCGSCGLLISVPFQAGTFWHMFWCSACFFHRPGWSKSRLFQHECNGHSRPSAGHGHSEDIYLPNASKLRVSFDPRCVTGYPGVCQMRYTLGNQTWQWKISIHYISELEPQLPLSVCCYWCFSVSWCKYLPWLSKFNALLPVKSHAKIHGFQWPLLTVLFPNEFHGIESQFPPSWNPTCSWIMLNNYLIKPSLDTTCSVVMYASFRWSVSHCATFVSQVHESHPPFILNTPYMIPMECGNSWQKTVVSLNGVFSMNGGMGLFKTTPNQRHLVTWWLQATLDDCTTFRAFSGVAIYRRVNLKKWEGDAKKQEPMIKHHALEREHSKTPTVHCRYVL